MGARWPRSEKKNIPATLNGDTGGDFGIIELKQSLDKKQTLNREAGSPGLETLPYGGKAVRAVKQGGQVWFVAQDVCDVLNIVNSRQALRRLNEREKGVREIDTLGSVQKAAVITYSGAMCLIIRSNKPEAEPFRLWVTEVVLPAVLETGTYTDPAVKRANSPDITLPGPGRYSAHMTESGQVSRLLASEEEAATRIYYAEGRLMARQLMAIRDHWSIVQEKRLLEDAPRPLLGADSLNHAIAEGDRLATEFMPLWDISAQVKK